MRKANKHDINIGLILAFVSKKELAEPFKANQNPQRGSSKGSNDSTEYCTMKTSEKLKCLRYIYVKTSKLNLPTLWEVIN